MKISLINLLMAFLVLPCLAQKDPIPRDTNSTNYADTSIANLDKIVVTATRSQRRAADIPVNVTVIGRKEIAVTPAKSIDDIINGKSSIQLKRPLPIGEGIPSDIIIRGIPGALAASRLLILVDGIPTNVSGTPFLILNEVPIDAVQQIEIVRGPYSALYGANAFSGVIHVITKTDYKRPSLKISGETSSPFGVAKYSLAKKNDPFKKGFYDSYYDISALSSGGTDRFSYLASGSLRTVGNTLFSDSVYTRYGGLEYYRLARNYDYSEGRFLGKGTMRLNEKVNVTVHTRYFNSELGFGKTKRTPDTTDIVTKGEKFLLGPYCTIKNDNVDYNFGLYYRRVNGQFFNDSYSRLKTGFTPSVWGSFTNEVQGSAQTIIRAPLSNTITVGTDLLVTDITFGATLDRLTNDTLEPTATSQTVNAGLYVQDEFKVPVVDLRVIPGVRYDYNSGYKNVFSPKLGLSWNLYKPLQIRGSMGKAFRAPSASELNMSDLEIMPDFVIRSNPNLKPEKITAIDGGLAYEPFRFLHLQFDHFYNWMDDMVVPRVKVTNVGELFEILQHQSQNPGVITHENTNKAYSTGIEVEISSRIGQSLFVEGTYSRTETRDLTYDRPLDYVARDQGSVRGRIFHSWNSRDTLKCNVSEIYVGNRGYMDWQAPFDGPAKWSFLISGSSITKITPPWIELKPYWRTDLLLEYAFLRRYTLSLIAQNLFGAKIEESPGTIVPKQIVTMKIATTF